MIAEEKWAALLADVLLVFHFGVVLFVVGGLLVIYLGALLRWRFVRNRLFRFAHIGVMAFVVFETVAGRICPLTEWEAALRERAGQPTYGDATFVQYWIQRLLYWDWPPQVFLVLYSVILLAIVASFVLVPIAPRKTSGARLRVVAD